ncbi:MAG: arginine repressor [Bacteroides sp.]|nr:arginine repressor [Bacteroides sp.]
MKKRKERVEMIINLITNQCIGSQEELARLLATHGYHVTQATLSRDLRQLRTSKIPTEKGTYMYVLPDDHLDDHQPAGRMSFKGLYDGSVSSVTVTCSGNMLVIKTRNGYAPGLAYDIDLARCPEILGTIPGADTIFAVLREGTERNRIKEILGRFMPHGTVYQLDQNDMASDKPPF